MLIIGRVRLLLKSSSSQLSTRCAKRGALIGSRKTLCVAYSILLVRRKYICNHVAATLLRPVPHLSKRPHHTQRACKAGLENSSQTLRVRGMGPMGFLLSGLGHGLGKVASLLRQGLPQPIIDIIMFLVRSTFRDLFKAVKGLQAP